MKKIVIKILNKINIKATDENLTMSHIKSFIQAKYRKILMSESFKDFLGEGVNDYLGLPKHKQEQIIFRRWFLESHYQGKLCLARNECPCSCVTSEVILADNTCDKKCYPEMMDLETWENYKRSNNFYVDLKNQIIIKYVTK